MGAFCWEQFPREKRFLLKKQFTLVGEFPPILMARYCGVSDYSSMSVYGLRFGGGFGSKPLSGNLRREAGDISVLKCFFIS